MNHKRRLCTAMLAPVVFAVAAASSGAPEALRDPRRQEEAADADELLQQAQATLRILNRISDMLPREPLEPQQLVDEVGQDANALMPDVLVQWMADSIAWLPYAGALRGPRGVLIERRANSLDQSLLLAEALEQAGHEVRLAQATLDAESAADLYAAVRPLRKLKAGDTGPVAAQSTPGPEFDREAQRFGADPAQLRKAYEAIELESQRYLEYVLPLTIRQTADLRGLLGDRSVASTEDADSLNASGIQSIRDHWWVQLADGNGGWKDLDALALAAGVELQVQPDHTCATDELPEKIRHGLTLRVVAERVGPEGRETAVALSHYADAKDLAGGHFKLSFGPLNRIDQEPPTAGELDSGAYTLRAATAETEWLPVLTSVDYEGFIDDSHTASIRTDGTLNESPVLDAKSRRVRRAADALGGVGETPAGTLDSHLTAVWIEYEIRSPGRPNRLIRRSVFDLLGEARRAKNDLAFELEEGMARRRGLALSGRTQILPATGRCSAKFLVRLDIATKLKNQRLVVQLAQASKDGDGSQLEELVNAFATPPLELFMLASMRLTVGRFAERVHIGSINVFASHSQPFEPEADETPSGASLLAYGRAIDVVANGIEVLAPRSDQEAPVSAWNIRLEQGVLDTVLENLALQGPDPAANASAVDERSRAANTAMWMERNPADQWRALAPGDELQVGTSDALARAQAALATNHVAILPAVTLAGADSTPGEWRPGCWWRVNLATGETLGIGPRGWGQEMAERAATARTGLKIIAPTKVMAARTVCFFAAVSARLLVSYATSAVGEWTGASDKLKLVMTMASQAGYTGMIYKTVNAACQVLLLT